MAQKKYNKIEDDNWLKLRNKVLVRDKDTCYRCKLVKARFELTVHHITPRSKGGSDEERNLVTLCTKCHDYVELHELSYSKIPKRKSFGIEKRWWGKSAEGITFAVPAGNEKAYNEMLQDIF